MRRDTREALKAAAKRNGITLEEAQRRFYRKPKDVRDEYEKRAAEAAGRKWEPEVN